MVNKSFYSKPRRLEKLTKAELVELVFDLINSFRLVSNPKETAHFLQDLLTAKEIKNLSKRLRIAKLLLREKTHKEIVDELHVSYESVAKISVWLSHGGKGFRSIISKLPLKYDLPKKLPAIPIEFQLPQLLSAFTQQSLAKNQINNIEALLDGLRDKDILNKEIKKNFKPVRAKKYRV